VAITLGDHVTADEVLARALGLDAARALTARGLALAAAEHPEGAAEAMRRAEAHGADSIAVHWTLGRAALAAGEQQEAVARLARAASGRDARVLQDLVDLAREGVAGAADAIRASGDRRARAAIGEAEPYLG
jgi:hypothetical protein